jgi:precorrin-2 methylase
VLLVCGVVHAENNPALAPWGDALFYSTIGTLYRAAQLDAVATVAEAWADTAIRLALYISPVVRT